MSAGPILRTGSSSMVKAGACPAAHQRERKPRLAASGYWPLTPAFLMTGTHLSISVRTSVARASGL